MSGKMERPIIEGDRPSLHGKLLGEALALMAELGWQENPTLTSEPCLTCAFRKGSIPNQSAGTGKMALDCVLGIVADGFACHHGIKDREPQRLCSGYLAAQLVPFPRVMEILRHLRERLEAIDEGATDEVREAFDAWLRTTDPRQRMDVYEAARAYAKEMMEVGK